MLQKFKELPKFDAERCIERLCAKDPIAAFNLYHDLKGAKIKIYLDHYGTLEVNSDSVDETLDTLLTLDLRRYNRTLFIGHNTVSTSIETVRFILLHASAVTLEMISDGPPTKHVAYHVPLDYDNESVKDTVLILWAGNHSPALQTLPKELVRLLVQVMYRQMYIVKTIHS